MLLDFNAISKINDIKTQVVDMESEWGGNVKIKAFDFQQQIDFEKRKNNIKDDADLVLLMLKMSIVDDQNNLIFNDSNIDVLSTKNSKHLFKIFKACLDLNALNSDSVDEKAKN